VTTKLAQSQGSRIALGVGLAAFAQFLALFLSGSGEGWNAPFSLSISLWFLMPLSFALAWPSSPTSRSTLAILALIALAADALLIEQSAGEASYIRRYIDVNGAIGTTFVVLWLFLWLCWQVLLLYSLIVRTRRFDGNLSGEAGD
jgi:hypothetical protein